MLEGEATAMQAESKSETNEDHQKAETDTPKNFEEYKFAREILAKQVEYRREKQWKIFSWTNSILLGITGGLIAISGKGFVLQTYHKVVLLGAIIVLTAYSCIWINENWRKSEDVNCKMVSYDTRFKFSLAYSSPKRILGLGYVPTVILLALAAAITIFLVPDPPPDNRSQPARDSVPAAKESPTARIAFPLTAKTARLH